jgi:hypothetical protein
MIPMNEIDAIKQGFAEISYEVSVVRYELAFGKLLRAIKAGFNEEQRRDERGRWTAEGGIEVTTFGNFLTGIPTIDNTSEALSGILTKVMATLEYLPEMSPQYYGIAVHAAFGVAVKWANLPGVGDIERSFSLEDSDPRYGLARSVRTDVTLRNIQGDIIAIYDVKTGDKQISHSRADALREKARAAPGTPVFELNIVRGLSRKYHPVRWSRPSHRHSHRTRLTLGRL